MLHSLSSRCEQEEKERRHRSLPMRWRLLKFGFPDFYDPTKDADGELHDFFVGIDPGGKEGIVNPLILHSDGLLLYGGKGSMCPHGNDER